MPGYPKTAFSRNTPRVSFYIRMSTNFCRQTLLICVVLLSTYTLTVEANNEYTCASGRCFGQDFYCDFLTPGERTVCCVHNSTYDYCVPLGEPGEPCDPLCRNCNEGLACTNGFCLRMDPGCGCTVDSDCTRTPKSICLHGKCAEECQEDGECPESLSCVEGKCLGRVGIGESCIFVSEYIWIRDDNCSPELYCNETSYECVPRVSEGESCSIDQNCLQNMCYIGVCNSTYSPCLLCLSNETCVNDHCEPKKLKPLGSPCTDDINCESGFCESFKCGTPFRLALGEPCTEFRSCESQYCGLCENLQNCTCVEQYSQQAGEICGRTMDCDYGLVCSVLRTCLPVSALLIGARCSSNEDCGFNLSCVYTDGIGSVCVETLNQECSVPICAQSEKCACSENATLLCQFEENVYTALVRKSLAVYSCSKLKHSVSSVSRDCPLNWNSMSLDQIPELCHQAVAKQQCCDACQGVNDTRASYVVDCAAERIISFSPNNLCCGKLLSDCYDGVRNCQSYLTKYDLRGGIDTTLPNTTSTAVDTSHKSTNLPIIITIVVGVALIILAIIVKIAVSSRKKKIHKPKEDIPLKSIEKPQKYLQDIEVLELIGSGAYSQVYKGLWQSATIVALKKPNDIGDTDSIVKEVSVLSKLSHRCIVQFFGMFRDENNESYIVAEYMEKGPLLSILQSNKDNLTILNLLDMVVDIASGMVYLSEQNIVHRDLALRNVLVTSRESSILVKIADFGMSRYTNELGYYKTEDKSFPVKWSAPEVLNYGKYSAKSDVWSFGVTVWEILSFGAVPWSGLSNTETVEEVTKGNQLSKPENCPDKLWDLIKATWAMEANERPAFKEILATLKELQSEMPEEVVIPQIPNTEATFELFKETSDQQYDFVTSDIQ